MHICSSNGQSKTCRPRYISQIVLGSQNAGGDLRSVLGLSNGAVFVTSFLSHLFLDMFSWGDVLLPWLYFVGATNASYSIDIEDGGDASPWWA